MEKRRIVERESEPAHILGESSSSSPRPEGVFKLRIPYCIVTTWCSDIFFAQATAEMAESAPDDTRCSFRRRSLDRATTATASLG